MQGIHDMTDDQRQAGAGNRGDEDGKDHQRRNGLGGILVGVPLEFAGPGLDASTEFCKDGGQLPILSLTLFLQLQIFQVGQAE
ncbi:hypothetical protein D9M68_1000800 [compost metagenome]